MADLREFVRHQAGGHCEYCRFPDQFATLRFHLDRVVPGQHGGEYSATNCAWSCPECNSRKLSNLGSVDPNTREKVWLFDPRNQSWHDHFRWDGARIVGTSAVGRATARLLQINAPHRVIACGNLIEAGLLAQ